MAPGVPSLYENGVVSTFNVTQVDLVPLLPGADAAAGIRLAKYGWICGTFISG